MKGRPCDPLFVVALACFLNHSLAQGLWPLPNDNLCGSEYKPKDADISGLKKYTDGDGWIMLVETDHRCNKKQELGEYGIGCSMDSDSGMKVLEFAAAVYILSQQVWLPPGTVILGKAEPNVPGNPRKQPDLDKQTIFMPSTSGCIPTQHTAWSQYKIYGSGLKCQRKGFLMNNNTALRNFMGQGAAEDGQGLGMGLAGGGFVELPGCATSYASEKGCGGPDERNDDVPDLKLPNRWYWTGNDSGNAVHTVLVENLRLNDLLADTSSNTGFWSAMTTDDSPHTDITFRKVVSMRTNQDGVNVHGSVVNWRGEDLHFENTGDDVYAVWGAGADATHTSGMPGSGKCPPMTNAPATAVSFNRLFAKQKPGGSYGTCFSIFGGREVSIDSMVCCEQHSQPAGIIHIEKDFCASYPSGETNITVVRSSWFGGTRDLCHGNPGGQFEDDDGLDGSPIPEDNNSDICHGGSGKGLCGGGGCTWVSNKAPSPPPAPTPGGNTCCWWPIPSTCFKGDAKCSKFAPKTDSCSISEQNCISCNGTWCPIAETSATTPPLQSTSPTFSPANMLI